MNKAEFRAKLYTESEKPKKGELVENSTYW